jgi:hypothetical protein
VSETEREIDMTLQEVRDMIIDMRKRYNITHSKSIEDQIDGKVKFVDFHICFKVDDGEKPLDSKR